MRIKGEQNKIKEDEGRDTKDNALKRRKRQCIKETTSSFPESSFCVDRKRV